jgi:hypothetical protein
VSGWDFVDRGTGWYDPNGHGTHVAGVIAALAGNGIGGAGLAQGVRILPVRVLNPAGAGSDADLANGIVWAADHGAKVINLSVGSAQYSPAEAAAAAYATQRGALLVSASGNYRTSGNPVMYPAAFPNVIGVGASDSENAIASFSNTGSYVDLAAPGVGIVSTYRGGYSSMDGTSAATPMVSASAALVRAADPGLSPAQVTAILEQTALDIESPGKDAASGYGLVQPLAAVKRALAITEGATTAPRVASSDYPSRLSVISAPSRATYGSTARVTFGLTVASRAARGARVTLCSATAPSSRARCVRVTANSRGRATLAVVARGHLTVWARYDGTSRVARADAPPVAISALPRAVIHGGTRSLGLTLRPVTRTQRVTIMRYTGSKWVRYSTSRVATNGRLTVTRLTRGILYRVWIPATDRTLALTTAAVRAR